MPYTPEKELVKRVQRGLQFPWTDLDGEAGAQTWQALDKMIGVAAPEPVAAAGPAVESPGEPARADERSEAVIATLLPRVRPLARALVHAVAERGITIRVISGLRTYAEQDALYAHGRTAAGSIVTNARGGFSNHNFGIAFDIGVFVAGKYLEDSPAYNIAGQLGKALRLQWGGDWKSIQDEPHFELRPEWAANLSEDAMLAGLRNRRADGRDSFSR